MRRWLTIGVMRRMACCCESILHWESEMDGGRKGGSRVAFALLGCLQAEKKGERPKQRIVDDPDLNDKSAATQTGPT